VSTRKSGSKKNKNNMYYIVGAVVAALIVAGVLIAVSVSGGDGGDKVADEATIAEVQENMGGIPANGLVLGEPDAPVTISEYSDIACIHCRTAALQAIPVVVDELVRDGEAQLRFVPTAFISASSERGALGVLAAAEQDAAWPFAEVLFHIQGNASTDWLSDSDMETVAEQLGLDVAAWREAYEGDAVEDAFIASRDAVAAAGVTSTPTFIITGPGGTERVEGAVPAAELIAAVEKVSTPS
jgi:protein-disulfide isomerase